MEYEWDPLKAKTNLTKHGIDFADAVTIFGDDYLMTIEDSHPEEERFVAIGMDGSFRILVVSFTWRGNTIRLISARNATKGERKHYEHR